MHAIVAVAAVVAATLALVSPATPAFAASAVTVTPATNLAGGQVVSVDASGLPPTHTAGWCQAVGSVTSASLGDCGAGTANVGGIDGTGNVHGTIALERYIYVSTLGRWVDCVDPAAHCLIAVADETNITDTVAVAPLTFSPPPAPPATRATISATDSSGGAQVTGSGFRPGAVVDVYQCVTGAEDPSGCNAAAFSQTADSGGALRPEAMDLRDTVTPYGGSTVSCLPRSAGACSIVAAEAVDFPGTNVGVALPALPPVVPKVLPGAASVREGDSGTTTVSEPVKLSSSPTQTVTVQWSTVVVPGATGGQADPATDYTPASGTVTFAPGETAKTVPIGIKGDSLVEPDETFVVSFGNPTNATIGGYYGLGFVTISNDDHATVLPGSASAVEGDAGSTNLELPVALSNPSTQTVTVQFKTVVVSGATVGQADPATDYTPTSGTVTFAPGETATTVPITIRGDAVVEPDESFVVSFGSPTNARIGGFWGLAFATITNDD